MSESRQSRISRRTFGATVIATTPASLWLAFEGYRAHEGYRRGNNPARTPFRRRTEVPMSDLA
jgi:hypothetical protein